MPDLIFEMSTIKKTRGRPRKYATEEEKMDAKKLAMKKKYAITKAVKVSTIDKFNVLMEDEANKVKLLRIQELIPVVLEIFSDNKRKTEIIKLMMEEI